MRRARRWVGYGWALGIAVIAGVSLPQVGFAEQPLKQLPDDVASFSLAWVALPQTMVEVAKDHGPLAGASWGVVKGTSEVAGRVLNLMDESLAFEHRAQTESDQNLLAHDDGAPLPAWLNMDNGESRKVQHKPALLRYTF